MVIELAREEDREEILELYHMQIGREFCPWDEHYPSNDEITYDLSRDGLYVMREADDAVSKSPGAALTGDPRRVNAGTGEETGSRERGRIIAAVSLEEDPQVDELPCWTRELQPGGEIARVAVHPEYQNRGIARQMVQFALDRLRERGYKSFHGIVNALNEKALRSYAVFGFRKMGECDMYDQHFICYELKL